ncbi:MAG TPA: transposase [Balneolales bacterium]|nr:transposase [Balneolales bacterium]
MSYYRRHLPHWQPGNATYFITFRLAGSLPSSATTRLKHKKIELQNRLSENKLNSKLSSNIQTKIIRAYEDILDSKGGGPHWLARKDIAEIFKESIEYRNHKKYDLIAYCIMPNHVHMILKLLVHNLNDGEFTDYPLTRILQDLKSYTGLIANRRLNRKGSFWQSESYDHVVRDYNELERVIIYTLNNPVKAGLSEHWKKWPYSYCDPMYLPDF